MPDSLQDLYAANRAIQKENIVSQSESTPYAPKPIKLKLGEQPVIEPTSRYESYLESPAMLTGTDVNLIRAQNQSTFDQVGNLIARLPVGIALGTVQNMASILDLEDYFNTDDEIGNAVFNTMQDWQNAWNEKYPIYRERPGQSFDIGDPAWWVDNGSMLFNSAGAFIATGAVTGGILGKLTQSIKSGMTGAKAANRIRQSVANDLAAGKIGENAIAGEYALRMGDYINKVGAVMNTSNTVVNAIALNQAESVLEGMGVYQDTFNKKLQEGYSIDDAKQGAADAAATDININRFNILLNLTSAGMFTGANKAIQKTMGGFKPQILLESGQEAMEEGVNYIAQKEGELQAKEGVNYSFDSDRAISHLGDVRGMEAMVLGALGGAIQTAGSDVFGMIKNRSKNATDEVADVKSRIDPTVQSPVEKINAKQKYIQDYLDRRQKATTPQEADAIDTEAMHNFSIESAVNGEKGWEEWLTDKSKSQDQDEASRAKRGLDYLNLVKTTVSDVTNGGTRKILNLREAVEAKMGLDSAIKVTRSAKLNLDKVEADIAERQLSDKDASKLRSPVLDFYNKVKVQEDAARSTYDTLISDQTQTEIADSIEKKKVAKVQEKKDQEAASRAAKVSVVPNVPVEKVAGPSIVGGHTFTKKSNTPETIGDFASIIDDVTGDQIMERFPDVLTSESQEISSSEASEFSGAAEVFSTFETVDGDAFEISPIINMDGSLSGRNLIKPVSKTSTGKPNMLSSFKTGLRYIQKSADMGVSMRYGRSQFTWDDISKWMKDHGVTDEDYASKENRELLKQFLSESEIQAPISEISSPMPEKSMVENLSSDNEQSEAVDQKEFIRESAEHSSRLKRSIPNAINYAVQEFSGEINENYLINSNPDKIKVGANIIIDAYDGIPVPTISRDKNGNQIMSNGKRVVENHNATTAIANNREIPIAIYLADKNGNKAELIGWLPENGWLNEKKDGVRINLLDDPNPAITDSIVNEIGQIRKSITDNFALGNITSVVTSIKSISAGVPVQSTIGPNSVVESMPDLLSDVKNFGLTSPFAYYDNGSIVSSDASIEIANAPQLQFLPSGVPLILLPGQDGKIYAAPVESNTVGNTTSNELTLGLFAHIGRNAKAIKAYNDNIGNPALFIGTTEGLREYLKQFMHLQSADVFGNPNVATDRKVIVVWNKDGRTMVKYGLAGDAKPKVIDVVKMVAIKEEMDAFINFTNGLRRNFQIEPISLNKDFVSIGVNGIKKQSYSDIYSRTLNTNYIVAGKSDSKNIYLIQPIIEFEISKAIPNIESIELEKREATIVPEKPSPTRKQFTKINPIGNIKGTELPRSPKIKSIGIETAGIIIEENPLMQIDPSDIKSLGDTIERHCGK